MNSEHYKSRERLNGLLRKVCVSSAIASRSACTCITLFSLLVHNMHKKYVRMLYTILQVSSDIIKRCCSKISLDDVFDGFVERSRVALEESISCCHAWKDTYDHISRVHTKFSSEEWLLDESSIFAQIDAFIQRCKDLLEVVEGQVRHI